MTNAFQKNDVDTEKVVTLNETATDSWTVEIDCGCDDDE